MRRPLFAANWKMNHGPTAASAIVAELRHRWTRFDSDVILFPPALSFAAARHAAGDTSPFRFGVQNVYTAASGAFTGENSAPMAKDAGAEYVLVGHSERRQIFGETDSECAEKCAIVERSGMTPLLCVGETLEQREGGDTASVVTRQLRAGLAKLDQLEMTTSVIAYEPVWAIGTGKTATPDDASETHGVLRRALRDLIGDRADEVRILYGGSVNAGNARQIMAAPDVDGVLVGGASLEVDSWLSICSA